MLGLLLHLLHQPGALDDLREAGIIFDVGGDGELPARLDTLHHDRREAGAGAINGGGEAGRSRAENKQAGRMGSGHRRSRQVGIQRREIGSPPPLAQLICRRIGRLVKPRHSRSSFPRQK